MHLFHRVSRTAIGAAALLASLVALTAAPARQTVTPPTAAPATQVAVDKSLWLYKGSDIPPDPDWRFGTLPNGVRYAVRKNGVPPGQVAIRVRIDAGSLMERDNERGYAHLIEHLSFRGSEHVPDGEAKRVWQRMGVTFGADSNASTSFTQTLYKLDLPSANETNLDESVKILSGMLSAPGLTQGALDAERPVVLAESREQPGPQVRLMDRMRETYFAGQPLAERSPIGTPATLTAATAASVREFHNRWYRPERAVVVIAGDMDPAIFERMIVKHFADWKGVGEPTPTPDFGKPQDGKTETAAVVEPSMPALVSMAYLRPWTITDDTIIFNQRRLIDHIALRILNRRLESRARGGAFISASANLDDESRSANMTRVDIVPIGADWQTAVKEVRQAIADLQATQPTQAEIDREITEVDAAMRASVDSASVEAGVKKAEDLVEAVDIKETIATAQASLDILRDAVAKKMFTPATVQQSAKSVFSGTALRGIVNTPAPNANATAELAAALKADIKGATLASARQAKIGFNKLPRLGTPGKVASRAPALADPAIERIEFANGVKLLMFANPSEASRVYVRVRFGGGMTALPADRPTPAYAGNLALVASGIKGLGLDELDRLTSGRRIGLEFAIDEDAFVLGATTSAEDLPDQLKLMATKLTAPGWDPKPLARARAMLLASYASLSSSPDGVLQRDLDDLLHDGDARWETPSRERIEALDAKSFRDLWEPLLASGPIEVQVYGDVKSEAAVDAVARTFGALKPRAPSPALSTSTRFPAHVTSPVVRHHEGEPTQAAAVIAWPTGGGIEGIAEGRKLDALAAIFRDRLIDKLRSQAGISYTPNLQSSWPLGMANGGRMVAIGMVPPDKTGFFFELVRGIAADLVAKPVDTDELRRAIVPLGQLLVRMSSGNMFWLQQTEGGTHDPRRLAAVNGVLSDLTSITPTEMQALAAKYLRPDKDWTMVVPPQPGTTAAAPAAPAPSAPAVTAPGR